MVNDGGVSLVVVPANKWRCNDGDLKAVDGHLMVVVPGDNGDRWQWFLVVVMVLVVEFFEDRFVSVYVYFFLHFFFCYENDNELPAICLHCFKFYLKV